MHLPGPFEKTGGGKTIEGGDNGDRQQGHGTKAGNLPHLADDMKMVDLEGIEPTTYCMQGNCSPN